MILASGVDTRFNIQCISLCLINIVIKKGLWLKFDCKVEYKCKCRHYCGSQRGIFFSVSPLRFVCLIFTFSLLHFFFAFASSFLFQCVVPCGPWAITYVCYFIVSVLCVCVCLLIHTITVYFTSQSYGRSWPFFAELPLTGCFFRHQHLRSQFSPFCYSVWTWTFWPICDWWYTNTRLAD